LIRETRRKRIFWRRRKIIIWPWYCKTVSILKLLLNMN